MESQEGVGSQEVLRETGATYRQIDHWCRTGLVRCHEGLAPGSGSGRTFDVAEVAFIRVLVGASQRGKRGKTWPRSLVPVQADEIRAAIAGGARFVVLTDEGAVLDRVPECSGLLIWLEQGGE